MREKRYNTTNELNIKVKEVHSKTDKTKIISTRTHTIRNSKRNF